MNTADMKATMRATLGVCASDNERLIVVAAAIRAQATTFGRPRKEEASRCLALVDAIDRYARGELEAADCRRIVDEQATDLRSELLDLSQSIVWNVDKYAPRDNVTPMAAREHKRLSSVLPAALHGCGVGDTPAARKAVNQAVLDTLVAMLNTRGGVEMRGAA